MAGLRLLWLGLVLLLAACAAGSGSDSGNNAKNHGFYGGTNGGWTQLPQQ